MKNKIKTLVSVSLLSFMFMFLLASVALAAIPTAPGTVQKSGVSTPQNIVELIEAIAGWFQIIVLAIAAIMIIYAGLTWMTAGGDDEKLKTARQTLIYALVGIAVVVVAYGLIALMKNLVGA